mmetsp:Transcript_54875/g.95948  ORF Transcript_54875/g.95948 Transcript_54875/m.95948 type:complete len:258 (-) Transcript_54875:3260-4033(-)
MSWEIARISCCKSRPRLSRSSSSGLIAAVAFKVARKWVNVTRWLRIAKTSVAGQGPMSTSSVICRSTSWPFCVADITTLVKVMLHMRASVVSTADSPKDTWLYGITKLREFLSIESADFSRHSISIFTRSLCGCVRVTDKCSPSCFMRTYSTSCSIESAVCSDEITRLGQAKSSAPTGFSCTMKLTLIGSCSPRSFNVESGNSGASRYSSCARMEPSPAGMRFARARLIFMCLESCRGYLRWPTCLGTLPSGVSGSR